MELNAAWKVSGKCLASGTYRGSIKGSHYHQTPVSGACALKRGLILIRHSMLILCVNQIVAENSIWAFFEASLLLLSFLLLVKRSGTLHLLHKSFRPKRNAIPCTPCYHAAAPDRSPYLSFGVWIGEFTFHVHSHLLSLT